MQKKIYGMFKISCLCLWSLSGVFGVDSMKSVSVTEGESVRLNSDLTEIQREDDVTWRFNNIMIAKLNVKDNTISVYNDSADGRFRDRLKLDQTGSLIITNTRITHTGEYTVTGTSTESTLNIFRLTVYANLPVTVIGRDCSSSSSSSSQQNCLLLCSVVNVSDVTLSWYKGNSLLSSISESNISISLSLPLEVEYQDKNSYSCVINNPIRNQTTHLNNTQLCLPCSGLSLMNIGLIFAVVAVAGSLLIIAAVWIFCICRKTDQRVQHGEEIIYADPTFCKRKAQKSRDQVQEDVVYAGVAVRH